jgi:trigger factor
MKFKLKKMKACRLRLDVEVDPALVQKQHKGTLEILQRKANIKGFRQGKAPLKVVEEAYRAQMDDEVVRSLVSQGFAKGVKDLKLHPVGHPEIRDLKFEREKRLFFAAEFDVAPEFKLKSYRGMKLLRASSGVDEKQVRSSLMRLLESRAELSGLDSSRPAKEGDVLVCDVDRFEKNAYVKHDKPILITLDHSAESPPWADELLGMQIGQTREIHQDKSSGTPLYRIHLKDIKSKKVPELNDVFAKSFGKENLRDLENEIREHMIERQKEGSKRALIDQIHKHLLDNQKLDLPEHIVLKQKEKILTGKSPSEDEVKKAETVARHQVKLYFVIEQIAQAEGIEVNETEIDQGIKRTALEMQKPENEVREHWKDDIAMNIRHRKTEEFILNHATIKEER